MTTELIWGDFYDKLLGFVKSRVNNDENAEDILQEVFIKIHKNSSQLKDQKKLVSWLYQITRNTIIDFYRKKKLEFSDQLDQEFPAEIKLDEDINPQFIKCLMPFVNKLPEIYKQALIKTSLEGISQKNYAQEMNLSYSAAKSRIQRAKIKLKESFTACCAIQADKYGNIISSNIDNCNC